MTERSNEDLTEEMFEEHRQATQRGESPPPLRGDRIKPPDVTERHVEANEFVLYASRLPATYEIDVWYVGTEAGVVWLQASEYESGTVLSADTLRERTLLEVSAGDGEVATRYSGVSFKVYEGGLYQTYAAYVRLMFLAQGSSEPVVLASQLYEINGWQH